jgi:subtilase family serine protease
MRASNFDPLYQRGISGKGQTIAFIEVDGFDQGDLTTFNRTYGLPQVQPTVYLPQGATMQDMPPAEGETTMDLEYAHALAPGSRLQVYRDGGHPDDFEAFLREVAQLSDAKQQFLEVQEEMAASATNSALGSRLRQRLAQGTLLKLGCAMVRYRSGGASPT